MVRYGLLHIFSCKLIKRQGTSEDKPSPSKGESVPDYLAVGDERLEQAKWKKISGVDPTQQIRLVKLAHMRYQHPDLEEITTFLHREFF